MGLLYLIGILILLAPVVATVAFFKSRAVEQELEKTQKRLRALSDEIAGLNNAVDALRRRLGPGAAPEEEAPSTAPAEQPAPQEAFDAKPPADEVSAPAEAAEEAPPPALVAARTSAPPPAGKEKSLEETITSRWMVWLGALAIALAGTFLVKYAIDNGFLGPATRVTLGVLLGAALIAGGEWLRQHPLQKAVAAVRADHVPPALTASGLFTAFASIYAAFALYDFLPPFVAFAALAFVALLGIGLSLLQGPFVAIVGLFGSFLTPALIPSQDPSAWVLFGYLLVVEAACLGVARSMQWAWYAIMTMIGVALWPLIWIAGSPFGALTDIYPVGGFLLVSAAAYFALLHGLPRTEFDENWLKQMEEADIPEKIVAIASSVIALVLLLVVGAFGYGVTGVGFVCLISVMFISAARRDSFFDPLAIVASVLALFVVSVMPVPETVAATSPLPGSPWLPPELGLYAGTSAVFAALFGISGFAVLWRARRPALWAAISAAVPVLILTIAYYRIVDFGVDFGWAFLALALAGANLFAAERVERYRAARGLEATLGFYAAAIVALISLAAAMSVRQAWLSVALSLQLPALAWIDSRLRTRALQVISGIVASTVLTRLVLNYNILDYPVGDNPAFSWVIYGYGIPVLAFYFAARLYKENEATALIKLLESGALAFFVLLVSMEIRLVITGSLDAPGYNLLEQSLQSISWLMTGTALALYHRRKNHDVACYGAMILLALAAAQILFLQLLANNPFLTGDFVGRYPLVNVLLLAYAVPAGFAFYASSFIAKTKYSEWARLVAIAGFVLVFAYLTLEVARAYQGPNLSLRFRSDAQNYTYSVVWLGYGFSLLALGIFFRVSFLRFASLAIVLFTAFKVFVFDMSGLTGLYRVGSFLGLGLSLVGIGYIYQRFVFRGPGDEKDGAERTERT